MSQTEVMDSRSEEVRAALGAMLPPADVQYDVPLSSLSRWRVGGPADIVVTPSSLAALRTARRVLQDHRAAHVVIGDGSNLLFADAGLRAVVLRVGRAFATLRRVASDQLDVGAGYWMPTLVRSAIAMGLGGIEHAIGIPGTFGGLCVMNGGSQRRGVGEHILHVDAVDPGGDVVRLSASDLAFAYRRSRLQEDDLIMVGGRLQLEPANIAAMRRRAIATLAERRAKFPRIRANCGSVFVSDPALYDRIGPPGRAIEQAGLKGLRAGEAQISDLHANFIVNHGSARAADILSLIKTARDAVARESGIEMAAEVRYVDETGAIVPAHVAADRRAATA